jgi:hypothetical protein
MAKRGRPRKPTSDNIIPPPPPRRELEEAKNPNNPVDLLRLEDRREKFLRDFEGPSFVRDGHLTAAPPRGSPRIAAHLPPLPRDVPLADVLKNMEREMFQPAPSSSGETSDVATSCGKTGRRLVMQCERPNSASSWRVRDVVRNTSAGTGKGGGPAAEKLDIQNFDFSGASCPECKSSLGPIACGSCGILGCCGGESEYLGSRTYTCPHCRNSGRIVNGLREVDAVKLGTEARSADSAPRRALTFLPRRDEGR